MGKGDQNQKCALFFSTLTPSLTLIDTYVMIFSSPSRRLLGHLFAVSLYTPNTRSEFSIKDTKF